MEFNLKTFNTPIIVERFAYVHFFEFTNKYHTVPDSHDFCELIYVDKGYISVKSENFSDILYANQLIIHKPGETHSLHCIEDVYPDVIVIGFECKSPHIDFLSGNPATLANEQKKLLSKILNDGMSVYSPPFNVPYTIDMKKRPYSPFGNDQLLKNHLEEFLISLVSEVKNDNYLQNSGDNSTATLELIYQYINENYREKISLDNLCSIFATNKTTLCRDFKNHYGVTLLNHINNLKLKHAKKMLREERYSITEIAEQCGFNSVHYFCRFFTKHTGISPRKYYTTIKSQVDL